MKYIVYGTISEWRESPFVYTTIEEAFGFFHDLHPAYISHYNIVEIEHGRIHEIYTYEDFVRAYNLSHMEDTHNVLHNRMYKEHT